MLRKLSLAVLLSLLVACTAAPAVPPTPVGDRSSVEEQAVYAVILAKTYSSNDLVLMDTTATDATGVDNTDHTLAYVLQNLHDVSAGTEASFRSRNNQATKLRPDMQLGLTYTLMNWDQRNLIFGQNQSGWEEFYNQYPASPGITTLSRVGFNSTFDQALVYLGTQSNWLAGSGDYLLLKKINGSWVIDQTVKVWIS